MSGMREFLLFLGEAWLLEGLLQTIEPEIQHSEAPLFFFCWFIDIVSSPSCQKKPQTQGPGPGWIVVGQGVKC